MVKLKLKARTILLKIVNGGWGVQLNKLSGHALTTPNSNWSSFTWLTRGEGFTWADNKGGGVHMG